MPFLKIEFLKLQFLPFYNDKAHTSSKKYCSVVSICCDFYSTPSAEPVENWVAPDLVQKQKNEVCQNQEVHVL